MTTHDKKLGELMESIARRTVEVLMKLYKDETRELNRIFLSDGIAQIGYNEKTQSIEISRPLSAIKRLRIDEAEHE